MNGRKAKEQRQTILEEIKITMFQDGSIRVTGPAGGAVNNFMAFREMMNAAERAVLEKIGKAMMKEQESQIVKPSSLVSMQ